MVAQHSFKILCIDDDPDFSNYLLASSEPYTIYIECGHSIDDFNKKKIDDFNAFIIDLNLPDGSGVEIVKQIRNKGAYPIVVISGVFRDENNFRQLKEVHKVNYVLEKPLYPEQIDSLLADLINLTSKKKSPIQTDDKLQKLKEQYRATICDKIELLSKTVKKTQQQPDEKSITELKNTVHKIGGSAGSYGFPEVSKSCKFLENDIQAKLDHKETFDKRWLTALNDFLQTIKFHFQVSQETLDTGFNLPAEEERSSVYIIKDDLNFLNLIDRKKHQFPIDVSCESNPMDAKNKLLSETFNPRVIIVSDHFSGWDLNGYEIINAIKQKTNHLPTSFGLFLEEDDLNLRMEAIKKGVEYVFVKPVSPHALLQTLANDLELSHLQHLKVLVLDDDPDVCQFISSALNEVGIQVHTIEDPIHLYKSLEDFMPDVLLLDVFLPKYDGISLLKSLRSDYVYRDLITMIITFKKDSQLENQAYENYADDLLYKPFNKESLTKRIIKHVREHTHSQSVFLQKNLLGLNRMDMLVKKLREILEHKTHEHEKLLTIEIDHFSDHVLNVGRTRANKNLISISNLLMAHENSHVENFSLTPEKFAVLLNGNDLDSIQNNIETLLHTLADDVDSELYFNVSAVTITQKFKSVHEILTLAEEGLEKARNQKLKKIRFVEQEPSEAKPLKKEIILIDSDLETLKMLKTVFESEDINVKTYSEGQDAIDELKKLKENELPGLIISERKLNDMDGIEVLRRLKAQFNYPPPFYFLTLYSSDKDISEGLKTGALEYITKPFNLSILTQRALNTLNTSYLKSK